MTYPAECIAAVRENTAASAVDADGGRYTTTKILNPILILHDDREAVKCEIPGYNVESDEILQTVYFPALVNAYQDGKAREPGYPLDPAEEIASFEKAKGPLREGAKRLIAALIHNMNAAYSLGQHEGQEVIL